MPIATLKAHGAPAHEPPAPPASSALGGSASSEAARYAVLRRLASAIRHQIAGALQPVGMLAAMVERRVKADVPNVEALRKNCADLSALTRSASLECVALMNWLAPQANDVVSLSEGVGDCLHLMATELSFRGFSVTQSLTDGDALIHRAALRTVLTCCLMALTDSSETQAQVLIRSRIEGAQVVVSITIVPIVDGQPSAGAKGYRAMAWADARALAQAEGVGLEIEGPGVQLKLDLVQREIAGTAGARPS